ncbi:MAG: coenzyme hydrogenase/dehydrogenase beta subunit-like protein, partial [Thermomicrobiales bacterium]|nr:coenzyme hydrogenase/dehydrogenase beta subunit-like protein [Thermomicrobiales bacterium]
MSAAFAIRDQMNDIDEAPGKVWFWELERAVIDAGRCIQCGVCVAACPSDSLGIGPDDLPKLVKMCTGCSLCWDFCPRGGLRYEALGNVMAGGESVGARHALPTDAVASSNGHAPDARPPISDPAPPATRLTARVKTTIPGVQDGGVVSALLIDLLERGEIDGALVAKP